MNKVSLSAKIVLIPSFAMINPGSKLFPLKKVYFLYYFLLFIENKTTIGFLPSLNT